MKLSHLTFSVLLLASTSLSAATVTKDATKLPDTAKFLENFSKQEFPDPKMQIIADVVSAATDYHNGVPFVTAKYESTMFYTRGVEDLEHMESLKRSDDACNINLLSTYFSNPTQVWKKLIDWGFAEETATAGKNVRKPTKVYIDESGMITMYENNRWEIGYDALMSLYQEPTKWGNQTKPFPLWNDQKFVYDIYWAKKYGDMYLAAVARCKANHSVTSAGVSTAASSEAVCQLPGLAKGPDLKDKNDRYSREKKSRDNVLKAHNDYVKKVKAMLSGSSSGTAAANAEASNLYKTATQGLNIDYSDPTLPPLGLPPFKEILFSNFWIQPQSNGPQNVTSAELTFYPQIPTPWRTILELQHMPYFPETAKTHVGAFPYEANSEMRQVMRAQYVRSATTHNRYNLNAYEKIYDPSESMKLYRAASLQPDDSKLPFQLNRIAIAMDIRTRIDDLKANYGTNPDGTQTTGEKIAMAKFKTDMENLGFKLGDDFDITNKTDREDLNKQLRQVEDELIGTINKMLPEMKKDPKIRESHKKRIANIEELIKAFNKDSQNTVFLSLQNADKVDQAMKQDLADKEALAQYKQSIADRNKDLVLQCPVR